MAETEASAEKRIAALRREIEEHNRRYYEEAAPTIPDREYDRLYRELIELEERFPQFASADSPTQRVGGEPLKAFLLTRVGASGRDASASVSVSKNTMTLAQVAFIFCGIGMAAAALPQHRTVLLGFGVFPTLVLIAITVTALADYRLRRRRSALALRIRPAGPPSRACRPLLALQRT